MGGLLTTSACSSSEELHAVASSPYHAGCSNGNYVPRAPYKRVTGTWMLLVPDTQQTPATCGRQLGHGWCVKRGEKRTPDRDMAYLP